MYRSPTPTHAIRAGPLNLDVLGESRDSALIIFFYKKYTRVKEMNQKDYCTFLFDNVQKELYIYDTLTLMLLAVVKCQS